MPRKRIKESSISETTASTINSPRYRLNRMTTSCRTVEDLRGRSGVSGGGTPLAPGGSVTGNRGGTLPACRSLWNGGSGGAGPPACLADAVRAIRGLVLHRRVPPRVEMDDRVRASECEANTAGFEADEKHGDFRVALEFFDDRAAIRRRAIEVAELNVLRRELVLEQPEHGRELAEDQHAVTAVHGLLQQLAKHRQLA